MSMVGTRVIRKEDPNLITGRGLFTDDVSIMGTTIMAFVRSTEAHADIVSVDLAEARALPGVLVVITVDDLETQELPGAFMRTVLAKDRVRFVGEPIAVVVAEDRYIAADAVELVQVTYRPLPLVITPVEALAVGAPLVQEALGTNVCFEVPWPQEQIDQVDRAFEAAPRQASTTFHSQRVHPVPMEPSAILADWGPDKLTVWASTQMPHGLRNCLSSFLGVPQHQCRVIQPDVGGGFGAKVQQYPELFLAPILSKRLGRPVKYVQTRTECFAIMCSGRDQHHEIDVAFDDDGHILGLRSLIHADLGAYPDLPNSFGMPTLTNWMSSGCYKIPAIVAGYKCVLTNKTPQSAYRGAGRPEASFLAERVVDLIADETGIDPAEVRLRNFIPTDEFPYKVPHAEVYYDSGNYPLSLHEALRLCDYENLKVERDRRNADASEKLMGIGFSTWVEIAAFGPRGALEGFGHIGSYESAQVKIQPDGTAIIATGASPHGQGTHTTLAMIAADELHMSIDNITVRSGDTDTTPQGVGTMGSRTAAIAGEATKQASIKVFQNACKIAAHMLEANPDDLECVDGLFQVKGVPSKTIPWSQVGWAGLSPTLLPDDIPAGCLESTVFAEPTGFTYPAGAYVCVVGIDRDTGHVEVEKFYSVDDCGTVINPLLAEGQVQGGIIQGIAQALFEEMVWDSAGQPLTTTLMDYLAPAASDVPSIIDGRTNTPTPHNSLGAKGIGESGTIGSTPAVVNAVVNALAQYGVKNIAMPISPQRVWRILNQAQGA